LRPWDELLEIPLDKVWIIRSGQAEPLCHPFYMGIDDDARLTEGVPENYIRGFSPDSRQGEQLIHRLRDLSAEALGHGFAACDKVFCFTLKESGGTNELFEFWEISRSQRCRFPVPPKECGSHLVDSLVGTLGGEDRGDE
jgi:hypothetical protein